MKRYWGYMYTAMNDLRSPPVVMAAAMAAMKVTAVHWDFAQTDAMEAVIIKVEEQLPLTFQNKKALGGILQAIPDATDMIWKHTKNKRAQATDMSSCFDEVQGRFATIQQAQAYWTCHYEPRRENNCQRRNRITEDAIQSTAMELNELYSELNNAKTVGFKLSKTAVADEAGDVWYGVRCYATTYREQVQRVLTEWKHRCQDPDDHGNRIIADVDYGSEMTVTSSDAN